MQGIGEPAQHLSDKNWHAAAEPALLPTIVGVSPSEVYSKSSLKFLIWYKGGVSVAMCPYLYEAVTQESLKSQ